MPIVWFFLAFFGVYFVVTVVRRIFHGIAYALGWLWGYTDSFVQGRVLRALMLFSAIAFGAFAAARL